MTSASPDAPLMLSISGARGIVGKTMTPTVAAEFAASFGWLVAAQTHGRRPRLVVGRDGRKGGESLALAAQAGLASVGCDVIDLGVTMTPSVGVMIKHLGADGGIAITASHNPIEWNGVKCLDRDGLAPPKMFADEVIGRFSARHPAYVPTLEVGTITSDDRANETHIAKVLAYVDAARIRTSKFHVVLDSVNASGCVPGRALLERLGCRVTHLFGEPTGVFGHLPEPIAENLKALCDGVGTSGGAVCGFAQDPDADRLAIVDERGQFIGEEYTLVLAALRVLTKLGTRAKGAVLATNLSTSRMIDDVAGRFGATVLRSAVGEANVVAALKPARGVLGGEGNGGVIVPEICWVRDSLSAMAIVLELLAVEGKPLSQIVSTLPSYAMVKKKLDLKAIGGLGAANAALTKVKAAFASERFSGIDGVRVDFADGWVHLRASNTEPIMRIIAEAPTKDAADELVVRCAKAAGL